MASNGNNRDVKYALSKLLQMGTVEDYQREFEMLIKRVTIPESLQDFFKARITEAYFEIIAKEDIEHIVEKKIDVILPLQGEFASPKVKGSLDADEYIGVDDVSSAIDGVFNIGESNMESIEVRSSEDPNFKIQKKAVEYVRALNVAPLEVVFAGPVDEVRGTFVEFFEDKGCVKKVLSATKLPESENFQSAYSSYHLEGKVIFEGVMSVTAWVAKGGRIVLCYVQGSGRRKRKKGVGCGSGR
ncbi:hypothetical protein Tco_0515314 [Tanacetum coccineum]